MKFEKDKWYWMSHYTEGDVFYPVLAVDECHVKVDDKVYNYEEVKELTFVKAVMPDDNEVFV